MLATRIPPRSQSRRRLYAHNNSPRTSTLPSLHSAPPTEASVDHLNHPVGLAAGATKAAAGTVVVAVVLGTVVLSAIARAMTKTKALITDFLSLAGTMASVLLTIVVVVVGAGFLLTGATFH